MRWGYIRLFLLQGAISGIWDRDLGRERACRLIMVVSGNGGAVTIGWGEIKVCPWLEGKLRRKTGVR